MVCDLRKILKESEALDVLILILLEYDLRQIEAANKSFSISMVLILILLEYDLRPYRIHSLHQCSNKCLNPYSIGI